MARQRLGQHFLGDPAWREQVARAIRVSAQSMVPNLRDEESCWVEIGAGRGEMTSHLLSTGLPVYAVEVDPPLARRLQELTKEHANLTVVPSDILKTDIANLAAGRRVRIYGNLPYYITSPILHHIFRFADLIEEMHMVIQLEVAQRLTAAPGSSEYGYLSVVTQFYARPELVFRVPRGAFLPPPDVGSALVALRFPGARAKLGSIDDESFLDFVKSCFGQKRKTLINNLRVSASRESLREALAALKLRPDCRAEQLSVAQFAALYKRVES
jgi:16S rRNA (adenine1518-N6/adenine1519-N6)-dimethyltransferase